MGMGRVLMVLNHSSVCVLLGSLVHPVRSTLMNDEQLDVQTVNVLT